MKAFRDIIRAEILSTAVVRGSTLEAQGAELVDALSTMDRMQVQTRCSMPACAALLALSWPTGNHHRGSPAMRA